MESIETSRELSHIGKLDASVESDAAAKALIAPNEQIKQTIPQAKLRSSLEVLMGFHIFSLSVSHTLGRLDSLRWSKSCLFGA